MSYGTPASRTLVAIPAHNEAETIGGVVSRTRASVPEADVLVVDDGSTDDTADVVRQLGVTTAAHLCNLGYGRAIQTAIKYAVRYEYSAVATLDADGQHEPGDLRAMLASVERDALDLCVGSRFVQDRTYSGISFLRGAAMRTFSLLVWIATGQRVFDTTSGLRVINRTAFEPLLRWHFVDFNAEAIVYLLRLGYRVAEHPARMRERRHGQSMHTPLAAAKYPLKTLIMLLLAIVQAAMTHKPEVGR